MGSNHIADGHIADGMQSSDVSPIVAEWELLTDPRE